MTETDPRIEEAIGAVFAADTLEERHAARDVLADLVEQFPEDARLHEGLGMAYFFLNDQRQCLQHLDLAVDLSPGEVTFRVNRGRVRNAMHQYSEAEADFRKAIELAPENAIAYILLGDVLRAVGDAKGGLAAYQDALRHDPEVPGAYSGLTVLFADQGKHEQAMQHADRLVELVPDIALGWGKRADIELAMERYQAALDDYHKAAELAPEDKIGRASCRERV